MRFYVLYVQTNRIKLRVGGWRMHSRDERREERDRRLGEMIVWPNQVPIPHPGPRHQLPPGARVVSKKVRNMGGGIRMVTKVYEVDEMEVDPNYRAPRFSYAHLAYIDNLPGTPTVTGTGTLR